MQLVDELSMIYTACLMAYATFSHSRSQNFNICLSLALVALAVFITLYYHYLQDPVFHQNAYAALTATVLLRMMYLMERSLRPGWRKNRGSHVGSSSVSANESLRDQEILTSMWQMVAYGLSLFLTGFAIWVIDNKYCDELRSLRHRLGLPWGLLLEGHGWWCALLVSSLEVAVLTLLHRHLLTGVGAYFYITWGIWLRYVLSGRRKDFKLVWPSLVTSFPELVEAPSQKRS